MDDRNRGFRNNVLSVYLKRLKQGFEVFNG